jgi:phosphate transport system permease protein
MSTATSEAIAQAGLAPPRRNILNRGFAGLSRGAAITILVTLAAVATFLIVEALPALTASPDQLADNVDWLKDEPGRSLWPTIASLVFGTVLISIVALVIATPISLGVAIFTSHYAPRRMAAGLGYVVDLLAAIPSVIYGLWGAFVFIPAILPALEWLERNFKWIPLFKGRVVMTTTEMVDGREVVSQVTSVGTGRVALSAGIVLAIMILPIITAVTREVFLQTPVLHEEAALALGATRWEMIRMAVLPFGRSGMIGATMLGLGRALGETMAVFMILSPWSIPRFSISVLEPSAHNTIAANIALKFPEANSWGVSALIAMGLALFVITLLVNILARWVVARRAEFSGAN